MTRIKDIQKLIQNWEKESGLELSLEQRKKLLERIDKLAQEEFKNGMEYQVICLKGSQAD